MKVLIQQVQINDPRSSFYGNISDILIESGVIKDIQKHLNVESDLVIKGENLHLSPGWVDVFAHFSDPGLEHKETIDTGVQAAAAGGFTDVFLIPNTIPVIDTKSQVQYVRNKSFGKPVNVYPIGAISKNAEGKELAEMYDMRDSGAIAFSDGLQPVQSAGLLVKALQYVRVFEGVLIQIPDDNTIGTHGLMHEGIVSTQLGLAGKPIMSEEILVARDIKLARYANSKIHFTGVTSAKSLEYIRRAKDAGIGVTCSVTPYHLFFTESDLDEYDTNLKVFPPIRTTKEKTAIKQALLDGTIDCIATHHLPHETDSKIVEFEAAAFGMIGLETCYAAVTTACPALSASRIAELFSINPRKIFGLDSAAIEINSKAIVTIYQPGIPIEVNEDFIKSRSKNSGFLGKKLFGKVKAIVNGELFNLNQ